MRGRALALGGCIAAASAYLVAGLAAAAPPGSMTIEPNQYDYGMRCLGGKSAANFTIKNNSTSQSLTVNSISRTSGTADFTPESVPVPSPSPIPPSGSASFGLTFSPSVRGVRQATYTVNSSDGSQPINLSGTGVNRRLSSDRASVSFGDQRVGTRSPAQSLVVRNTGGDPVTMSSVVRRGANAGDFVVTTPAPPFTISAGQSQTLTIAFQPPAAGARSGALELNSNACGSAKLTVPLTGTGVVPSLSVDPNPIDVGASPKGTQSKPTAVTVANGGHGALKITAIQVLGTDAGDFTLVGLPAMPVTVAPAGTLVFSVRMTPSVEGVLTASLNIVSDDPKTPAFSVPLLGTGGTASPSPRASTSRTPSPSPSPRPSASSTSQALANSSNDSLAVAVVIVGVVAAFGGLVLIRQRRASLDED